MDEIDEAVKELAKEDKLKKIKPGPEFWYALLGALVGIFGDDIDGVPTVNISTDNILVLQGRVVHVADDPKNPGGFVITIRKQ